MEDEHYPLGHQFMYKCGSMIQLRFVLCKPVEMRELHMMCSWDCMSISMQTPQMFQFATPLKKPQYTESHFKLPQ